jgi:drug/metabolite transporter (DMT)-like permease
MNVSARAIPIDERHILIGFMLALAAAILFSIKAIFVKLAYHYNVDAVTLLALRMLFALPFFVVIAVMEERKPGVVRPSFHQMAGIVGLGLIGYYIASLFDFVGLQYISAGLERLILFLFPAFTVLISAIFLGRRIGRVEIQALLLSYAGIAISVHQEVALDGEHAMFGALLVFASTLAYAVFLVGSGELIPKIGSRRFMAYAMIVSCMAVIAQFLATHDVASLQQPMPVYGYGLAIAVFSTVLPAFMLAAAIHRIGASHTSIIGGIGPVSTIALAAVFLGESMNALQMAGAALVITGVLLLGILRRK